MGRYVEVPHRSLSAQALRGLIEDFVTRDGTDYGHAEHTLLDKASEVERELARGRVIVLFDLESQTATLSTREEMKRSAPRWTCED